MKVMLVGAHFTPAVAVIEQLKKYPNVSIIYVGRETTQEGDSSPSYESGVWPNLGIKFIPITTGRLQREFTLYTIPSLLKIPLGIVQSLCIILKEKPDVILSFGGYVAVPTVLVGWLFSIPIMIHEQTKVSGLANKISAFLADKIALSFAKGSLREKYILTGNPLRNEVLNPVKIPLDYAKLFHYAQKNSLPTLLIMGGNQGSHIINQTTEAALNKLLKIGCVIHITGNNKFNDFDRLKRLQNDRYLVKRWVSQEMGAILSKVDLIISRAGANTLYELAYFGKPALAIPFEPLYQDEQNENAKFFAHLGMVRILPQSKLSAASLIKNIRKILNNLNHFRQKAKNAKKVVKTDAAGRLALETLLLGKYI